MTFVTGLLQDGKTKLLTRSPLPEEGDTVVDSNYDYQRGERYGVVANGAADNTTAVGNTLARVAPAGADVDNPTGGHRLEFPAGIIKVTAPVDLQSFTHLRGEGSAATVLDFSALTEGPAFNLIPDPVAGYNRNLIFEGLRIKGPGSTAGVDCFSDLVNPTHDIDFRDVVIHDFQEACQLTKVTGMRSSKLFRCHNNRRGLYIEAPGTIATASEMNDVYLDQNEQGMYLSRVQTFIIRGVVENNNRPTTLPDGNAGVVVKGCKGLELQLHYESNDVDLILDSDGGTLQAEWVLNHHSMFNPAGGATHIILKNARQPMFEDCTLETPSTVYMQVYDATSGLRVKDDHGEFPWQFKNEAGVISTDPPGTNSVLIRTTNAAFEVWTEMFRQRGASAAHAAYGARFFADALERWQVLADGKQQWGDGANPYDVHQYRRIAGVLRVDEIFEAALGYAILSKTAPHIKARNTADTADIEGFNIGVSAADTPTLGDPNQKMMLRGTVVGVGGIAATNAGFRSNGADLEARLGDNSSQAKFDCAGYKAGGTAGAAAGTFTTADGKTVTYKGGIITSVA